MKRIALLLSCIFAAFFAYGEGKQEIEEEGNSQEPVELNFIEMLTSPSRTALIQSFIEEYEAENPGVEVNLISPPYEQAENKMTLMLNAKQPLDIIESRDGTIKQFVNNGQVISLESYLAGWDKKDDLMPISLNAARVIDNTAYIMPQLFFVKGMFVRTDLLEAENMPIPETIDGLIDASIALTDAGTNQFGYVIRGKHNAWKVSQDYLSLSGINNIDPDNFYKTEDGVYPYMTEEGKAGLKRYVELYQKAVPKDGLNWGFAEQINAFVSGIGAFLIQDPDAIAMIDEQLGRDKYTVVPIPVGKSGKAYQDFAFNGLSIVSYSKHQDEAWSFLSYMIAPENNAEFCKTYGALPVFNSTYSHDEYFSSGVFKAWNTMLNNPDKYVFVHYPVDSDKWPAWGSFQEQYMQQLLLGVTTVDDVTQVWADYWKD